MEATEPTWIGSTQQLVDGWRVVLHWQEIDGRATPAGAEVRRYNVAEEFPALDGRPSDATPEATHHERFEYDDDRPPAALTSTLLANVIRWGDVFAVQRARLVASLEEYAENTPEDRTWSAATGEVALRGMVWMDGSDVPVLAGTGTRADPANDATYRLVANLWMEIRDDDQLRKTTTASLMRLLRERHDFPLTPATEAHRVKVQGWLREARRRHREAFDPPAGRTQRDARVPRP